MCEIYHRRLKRLPGTIKAPTPSTSQRTVHYYSLKQKAFNMSSFPCEAGGGGVCPHVFFDDCWKRVNLVDQLRSISKKNKLAIRLLKVQIRHSKQTWSRNTEALE